MLGAASLHAGDFTIFGGAQIPGKLTLRSALDNAPLSFDPGTFGTFGLRFTAGGLVGTEQTIAYSPNFLSSENSAFIYNSNFALQAPLPVVRPYATVGLGTVVIGGDDPELFSDITGAKFAINYGGGVKVGGRVGVQFDARGYRLYGLDDETLNVLETSIGIVFTF
jgi:hypothetical protein